jgi:hypothetical protein
MSLQFHRYRTYHNRAVQTVFAPFKKGFPSVYEQAKNLGGTFTRITSGLPETNVANFSPSILRHKNSTLIAWRSQPEPFVFRHDMKYFYYNNVPTDLYIGELIKDDTIVASRKLKENKHRLSYEDPRLFLSPDDKLHCQFVTSTYATKWDSSNHKLLKTPKICVGGINEFGNLTDCMFPRIGNNLKVGGTEKNWCFYTQEDKLKLLYSTQPLVIKTPGQQDTNIDSSCLKQITGDCPTFNSTAPIKVDDQWLVFFHWKHMVFQLDQRPYLLYSLGVYMLDEKQTKITRMLKEPLFVGSTQDELITWTDAVGNDVSNQPACILPFGCFIDEDNELIMSLGVNDYFMGIFRTPISNILSLMDRV